MAICSFLGYGDVYDTNLLLDIRLAVEKVLVQGEIIEFQFFCQGRFYNLCLAAALEAKQRHPGRVTLTLILDKDHMETTNFLGFNTAMQDVQILFDKIIPLDLPEDLSKYHAARNKALRSFILNADYVISYYYTELRGEWARLQTAMRKSVKVIELSRDETNAYIKDCIEKLPERQSAVIRKINAGESYSSVGRAAGVTSNAIHEKDFRGRKRLRAYARDRLKRELAAQGPVSPVSCSLMLSGPPDRWGLCRTAVWFLIKNLGVTQFFVEHINGTADYTDQIAQICHSQNVQITVYSHLTESGESEWREYYQQSNFDVIHVDSAAKTVQARISEAELKMLGRSEYVIYDSTKEAVLVERIQKQIAKFRHLKVFDIGHTPCIQDTLKI